MNTLRSDSIIVGVDESALAGQAVRWAAEQAVLEGRRVRLVRAVMPVPTGRSDHAAVVQPGTFTSLRLHSEALLRQAHEQVHRVAPGVEVDEQLEVATARDLLLDVAEDAHLIVLGSRGRGPLLTHLFGSVGVGVVRRARCPVVVHRPGHPGRVRDGVVVAVDATEDAVPVLEFAFRQASLRRLPLRVVHYVMDPRSALRRCPDGRRPRPADCSRTSSRSPRRWPAWGAVPRRADDGPHHSGLAEHDIVTAASRADLLVVGTHQRPAADRLLVGSVSTAVLEHATCPVAVVPVRSS